ncbi:MAG: hypothetical protein FE834_03985 [Gammaproteobacteria bacterium]|nr:hypothetical protein [Gammaproteobacteria bacterium]
MTSDINDIAVAIFSLIFVGLFVGSFYLIRYLYRKFRDNMNIREELASIKSKTIDKIIAKVDIKIKERELLSLKAELARERRNIDDYNNEEIDLILRDKREKVIAKIKDKSLLGLLITLVIGI